MKYVNFKECKEIVEQIDRHTQLLKDVEALLGYQESHPTSLFSTRIETGNFHTFIPAKYNDCTKEYIHNLISVLKEEIDLLNEKLAEL